MQFHVVMSENHSTLAHFPCVSYGERMFKIGLVGMGKMGVLHASILNSIQPDAKVTAVCESHGLLLRIYKKVLPAMGFYENHVEMIQNEELDAVIITTPIDTHVPIIVDITTANHDLSIFVEKPLATSYKEAEQACNAASRLRSTHGRISKEIFTTLSKG